MRPGDPTVEQFDWQMALLARYFLPLPLADALEMTIQHRLPDRAVCVTFDDGYADNAQLALPILRKWRIPATVLSSTAFLDGGRMWNDTVLEAVRSADSGALHLTDANLGEFSISDDESRRVAAHTILNRIKHLPFSEREKMVSLVAQHGSTLQ
ncbi:MAG: polysaccharide deacetylase family protein [Halioglobus sp.]